MVTELGFYEDDRVAIFIDGANLYSAAKTLGFDIDYRKLLTMFQKQGTVVRAFYYTALFEDQEYSPIRPLVDWLDYNGYTVVTKPVKEFTDREGRRRVKGNMDIELAIDMMQIAEHVDHIVLFSGDGDFRRLVEAVQRKGVRVSVVSTISTQPPMIADELRRQCDVFVELRDLARHVARVYQDGSSGPAAGNFPRRDRFRREDEMRPSSTPATALEGGDDDEEFDDEVFEDADEPIVEKR